MEVPKELAALPRWIRYAPNKMPLRLDGTTPASSTDPTTWSTLADVLATGDSRIGFVFSENDGLVGIDLDDCFAEGQFAPYATEILKEFEGCYAEFSPSGRGVHIIIQGRLPDARGRKTRPGQPAIEIYSTGRYFTFTGDAIGGEVLPAQPALDRLLVKVWPARLPVAAQAAIAPQAASLDDRARRYLATIPPTVCGTASCHDRTFRVARSLVYEFDLPLDRAGALLAEWCAAGQHAWTEKELAHKIEQANSQPFDKPRGHLAAEAMPERSNVTIDLVPRVVTPPKPEPKPLVSVFPADCLRPPGLIGDIIDHTLATAYDPQPELALSGAIAMMSLLCGGKVVDKRKTRPNVYVIGVEKTSAGKDAARMTNKAILTGINAEELTEDNVGSDSGLTKYISDCPNCLLQIDEIHHMLVSMRNVQNQPHMVAVGRELLTLFPASGTFYKTKLLASTKRTTIRYPNVVLYGTCTVNGFWENITRELIEGGLLGRCMVFEGRGYVDSQEPSEQDVPESILVRARGWLDLKTHAGNLAGGAGQSHTPLLVHHTEDAWERTAEHRKNINQKVLSGEDDFRAAIWKRTAERTNKLALLFAASRCGISYAPTITLEDANLAIKISNWLTNKMLAQVGRYVAESDFERDCLKLVSFIDSRGVLTGNQMLQSPSPLKKLKPKERKDVLDTVQEGGHLFIEAQPSTGGRAGVLYYSAERWRRRLLELENAA